MAQKPGEYQIMYIGIDVGNSNIVIGFLDGTHVVKTYRLKTESAKNSDGYKHDFYSVFKESGYTMNDIEAILICSVVNELTPILRQSLESMGFKNIKIIGDNLSHNLEIIIDNPKELGMDMVVGNIYAKTLVEKGPIIVIDMGTATTISAIDKNGACIGCSIIPGVSTAMKALLGKTSLMETWKLSDPNKVIGTNTMDSLMSGAVYGSAAMLDGMIDRMEQQLESKASIVATGGVSKYIIPFCKREDIIYEPDLILKGLVIIYEESK